MPYARVKNFTVAYEQETEFNDLKREIFGEQIYYFETALCDPIIIDGGAHVGLATLYWKWLYPAAKVLAFEPNQTLIPLLEENVSLNQLTAVEIFPFALARRVGQRSFFVDKTAWKWYSTGSFYPGAWNGAQKQQFEVQVPAVSLNAYLTKFSQIDLLKLDIEGAEMGVLLAAKTVLDKVRVLIFEFHPRRDNSLTQLLAFLQKRGFSYRLKSRDNKTLRAYHEGELVLVEATRG